MLLSLLLYHPKLSVDKPQLILVRIKLPFYLIFLKISIRLNINFCLGTIGHVAHGKSTVVKAVSGVQTVRFKNELERNITIKLGMASIVCTL